MAKAKKVPSEIVVEEAGTTQKKIAEANKLKKIIVGVDNSIADVVKWNKEGRKLFFDEGDEFLELSETHVRMLSPDNRTRYDVAKNATLGVDIISNIEDGLRGWEKDYNVIQGSASAQTHVVGQDPKFDYRWSRKDSVGRHASKGYEVDHDPNVIAGGRKESCTYKTVGGQNKPELILLRRPKELSQKLKTDKKKQRDSFTQATLDNYVETAAQKGAIAQVESN